MMQCWSFFVIKSIEGAFTTTIQTTQITGNAFSVEKLELASNVPKKAAAFEELNANGEYLEDNLFISSNKITKVKQVLSRLL